MKTSILRRTFFLGVITGIVSVILGFCAYSAVLHYTTPKTGVIVRNSYGMVIEDNSIDTPEQRQREFDTFKLTLANREKRQQLEREAKSTTFNCKLYPQAVKNYATYPYQLVCVMCFQK